LSFVDVKNITHFSSKEAQSDEYIIGETVNNKEFKEIVP